MFTGYVEKAILTSPTLHHIHPEESRSCMVYINSQVGQRGNEKFQA